MLFLARCCHVAHVNLNLADIRNLARLKTISASSEASGWLQAAPLRSLGLDIPSPEFIMALKLWLGIPIFSQTSPSICPCSNLIDQYGDHLLGCAHGPYRIRRHDALRDVLYHTLKADNQSVKLEQRINGSHRKNSP